MSDTLDDERMRLRRDWHEGTTCKACTQRVQLYHRKLNSGMALALVLMYRAHGRNWQDKTVTLKGVLAAARDESLLRFWGLIEEDERKREDGGHAGWWRVTDLGEAFVKGYTIVPSHAWTFNSKCYGLDAEKSITIREALGRRYQFRLDELLRGL